MAADALTIGQYNVALGWGTLSSEDVGSNNVAVGYRALVSQNAPGGSVNNMANTAIGYKAAENLTEGFHNVFVGAEVAASGTITGSSNTAVGMSALDSLSSGSNNLALGHDAGRSGSPGGIVSTHSNIISIADENITNAHIQVALTVASDQRDKTDFVDLDLGLEFVKALEPVTYYWDKRSKYGDKYAKDYDLNAQTPDGTHKEDWMDIGFKAQAVRDLEEAAGYAAAAKKNLTVSLSEDGKQYGLQYEKFIPILVKAIQDQDAIITSLTARVAALES